MSTQVGSGAVVGDAVWDRQGRVRVRIGPVSLEQYNDFLPGGRAYAGAAGHYPVLLQRLHRF